MMSGALDRLRRDAASVPAAPPGKAERPEATVAKGPAWRATPALRRAVAVTALALIAAVATGRTDLVLVAAPFALGLVAALAVRPLRLPTARLHLAENRYREGEQVDAQVTVTNPDSAAMASVVAASTGRWLRLRYGVGSYVHQIPAGGTVAVSLRGNALRWGAHTLGPVRLRAVGCDGLLESKQILLHGKQCRVYPSVDHFDSRQAVPRPAGITGTHRSRRLGDGGELAEVRPFQPGDRLRRIDWRVSLRQRELYVNNTLSERDADVVVMIDVLHDAGPPGGSVLDVTVRAAAAITEHYVHQGDRVSIVEFGPLLRRLRAGTGRRHFLSALEWLTDTQVRPGGVVLPERLLSGASLPYGALVVMLTPLIDEASTQALARLVRSGRSVITVDTLPPEVVPPYRSPWTPIAWRLWRLDRGHTIDRLHELGVPVAAWRGPGSLDQMIAGVTRVDRAPKVVTR